jgi:hypothetical protein
MARRKKSKKTLKPHEVAERVSEVTDLYEEAIGGMRYELQTYWLNHSFLFGFQWTYWDENDGRLTDIPRDPERVRATVNRLWPNTRTVISTLMQRQLTFEVTPTDVDDSHLRGAKIAESVARAIHDAQQWETMREDLYHAVWKGGTAALCLDWDPALGDILDNTTEGGSPVRSGATVSEHLNITQFVVEPGARYPEQANWWIKAVALNPDEVQRMYPEAFPNDPPPADASNGLTPFQSKLLSFDRTSDMEIVDLTMVLTYYERPNANNEDGCVKVVVDGQIVSEDEKWPFPFEDRLNLVIIRETPKENRWTGDTVLSAARPLQQLLNLAQSAITEHMKQAGNARLMVPMSSIDLMDQLTDLPGEVLPYNDALPVKPTWLSPPQLPAWVIEQPGALADMIDDIMGVHDISRGSAPANIESGFGLSILAEKDTTPVSRLTKETAGAFGRFMSMHLAIYEDKTKGTKIDRKSIVNVPGQARMTVTWNGKDFKGQTNAFVPEDAILPRSRAAQIEMAKDLLGAGLIETVEEFMAVSELPGQRDILAAVSPDVERARRENGYFGLGRQSVPEPGDNHKAHIHEHNNYRKSVDYEMLAEEDQAFIMDHIQAHETLAAEEIGRQRKATAIDPALGEAANATEAPPLPPVEAGPMPGPVPAGPPMGAPGQHGLPAAAQGALPSGAFGSPAPAPEEATHEIMQLLQGMG